MSEGDLDTAIALYRGALERTPDDLRTQLSLANALSRGGDVEASIAAYQQALAKAEGGEPVSRYNLGILLLGQADLAGAIDSFEKAVTLAPTFTSAHFNLASALEQTGDLARATTHASQAAELAPEDDDTHLLLARLAMRQGDTGTAEKHVDTVLARRPSSVESWLMRGLLATEQRDTTAATAAFRHALSLEAMDEQQARAHIGLANLPGADSLDHLETASRLLPNRTDLLQRLAAAYGREGRMDKAAERYAQAVTLTPENLRAHFGLSTSLILGGRDQQAVRALKAALERMSDSLPLQHALARLLATSADATVRDGPGALSLAQQVFRNAPSIDHGETVAMALAELGRFEEAATLETRIIAQAQANNRQERIPALRQRLEQYRRGEPVRDPWRATTGRNQP
jgi:tetratricopeptide (TPR) repeat protein